MLRDAVGRRARRAAPRPRVAPEEVSLARVVAVVEEEIVAGSSLPMDVAASDDAHLRSLGIKPELRRTLGFLSNFAVAFSYISVSTGTFGN